MKCPILPSYGFKKDGSCRREILCDQDRIKICKDVRKEKSKAFQKLLTQRDKMKKKLYATKNVAKQKALIQTLWEMRAKITKMSNE